MSRSQRSVAIPTGMIIAALYVVLLVGFSRESYMRRDAMSRAASIEALQSRNISEMPCPPSRRNCAPPATSERQDCPVSDAMLGRFASGAPPFRMREVRQQFGAER
jgi:hypothetical protein